MVKGNNKKKNPCLFGVKTKDDDCKIKLSPTSCEAELEIYRQKYEVFRHFDNLRWQIPTLAISAGALVIGFAAEKDKPPAWWSFLIFGCLCLFSAFAVQRIRIGIDKNYYVLDEAAKLIGDNSIPPPQKCFGASWWLCVLLVVFGIGAIGGGFYFK